MGGVADFKHKMLYVYSTKHLLIKDKVRFYYGLKGRHGDEGVVKDYKINQLTKTVLLVPLKSASDIESFLSYWKCKYQKYEVMIK